MSTVYMMIGLPGSGKSTYRNELMQQNEIEHCVSTDDLIEKYAEDRNTTYNEVFKEAIGTASDKVDWLIEHYVRDNESFVWDQTNVNAKSRKGKLMKIPKYYKKVAIVVECENKDEHQKRLDSREGKTIPKHIMENMEKSFEYPTLEEGFDEIRLIKT